MSAAGNALVWTIGYFCLSFVAIYLFWFAESLRSSFVGKP